MQRHSKEGSGTNNLGPDDTSSARNDYYKPYEEHIRVPLDSRRDFTQGRGSVDPTGEDFLVHGGVTRKNQSWPYVDYSETSETTQSVHTSQSYNDFGVSNSSASGSYTVPQKPQLHSAPSSTAGRNERRVRRKRMGNSSDETSGYSTNNSISELSELTPIRHPKDRRARSIPSNEYRHREQVGSSGIRDSSHSSHSKSRERLSGRMGTPMSAAGTSKQSNSSLSDQRLGKRSESNLSVNTNSDISRNSRDRVDKPPGRSEGQSKRPSSMHSLDSKHPIVPRNGSIGVTVTSAQYDPNDPFAFIQTVKLPLHVRVRKCLWPIMALLLVLILAASLGAAIYFASALKETQEKQIEFLRANLVMKIRNAGDIQNLEELSPEDFKFLSSSYCRRMDDFYGNSQFSVSYRGCEVISIKNQHINFTLFFMESGASSRDIMSVIEKSAPKIEEKDAKLAQVDKFQVELDSVKVNIDTRREPETFNKKTPEDIRTTPPITSTAASKIPAASATSSVKSSFVTTERPKLTKTIQEQKMPTTNTAKTKEFSRKKSTQIDKPVYSWDPCVEYEGTYFPHPVRCDWFFQCNHDISLLQKCTSDLVYDWKSLACVSKFTRGIKCPNPSMAPPMPQTEAATTTMEIMPTTTVTFTSKSTTTVDENSISVPQTPGPQIENTPERIDSNLSAVAGRYSGRGDIKDDPCTSIQDGNLYAHPNDCAKFIQCVNGHAHEMGCAPGLVFEPTSNVCILPKNDLICPDIHPCKGHNDGYFPHPYNCSLFIQCQHNAEKIISCRPGLVWNTTVKSCVLKTKGMKCDNEQS
ncbi:hypothetical protein CHS0354_015124 [Potamilus streckersoni]|uniref:Chitin-binding type-2 domain-containing protein n=1 Tax=Potamilus streckersoni TaxID=2493646 RepID=A0AAE0VT40_9BIVA|nr:hypothetical protein CHS0354_015124 [Potamilus streckersoni]